MVCVIMYLEEKKIRYQTDERFIILFMPFSSFIVINRSM